ncbi:hypothetical protein [Sulfurimonas microaerophilic]|uniref:hypothetical protein n=1 Tax=Sulfurimonas microaerophilic TaxID=3058392 RepID=UPI002714F978|nr:hypothetical protein [Sulfurimonas sp. hsl 1-7]
MKKITLTFILLLLSFSGCVNKHGISAKYYSDCKEYYDLQGYYHKECGEDDIVTYEQMKNVIKKKETPPKGNVW